MGVAEFFHTFEHYDWRLGIKDLQEEAEEEYGHQQGYSGEINSMSVSNFSVHRPNRTFKSMQDVWDYVEDRIEYIEKREGEVIDLGITGYSIAKAVVKEYHGNHNISSSTLMGIKEPAVLLDEHGFVKARGTMAELKERGKQQVLKERFEHDYFIVGKNSTRIFIITGEGKSVKKTSRQSDANTLVLPYHKFVVYGVAPS